MLQPLTSEAQQVMASSHLGRPTAAYRAKFTIKKAVAVAFLFAVGLGILAVAILDSSSVLLSTVIAVVKTSSYGIQTATTHRYTLRRSDGATFKFNDNIDHVEALGNTIAAETARTLWPRYLAAYQAGHTLAFGKISLNQHGVNNGKEWLPWSQLREIQITRGYLSLKKEGDKQGNWRVIQAADIPNVDVFMALVNGIQSGKRS